MNIVTSASSRAWIAFQLNSLSALVIAEKRRPVTYCRFNLRGNSSLLAYIESVRASRFFARHRDIGIIVEEILEKVSTPFFSMMIFGSHVKGTASKRSDMDVEQVRTAQDAT